MSKTMQANPSARNGRRIVSIGVAPNQTTVAAPRNTQVMRSLRIAAAVIAPQGHGISLVLRTIVARRSMLCTR